MEFIQQGGVHNGGSCLRAKTTLKHQVGFDTDIGGGRENQDSFFVWSKPSITQGVDNILVIGVLDGHGREVGKVAAVAAKISLLKYFDEYHEQLHVNPYECLVRAHDIAHTNVKEAFRVQMIKEGYEVEDTPEGYLRRRKFAGNAWTCIHGGTSCSIIAIVGYNLFIANVGDSSGTLCCPSSVLSKSYIHHLGDAAIPPAITSENVGSIAINSDGPTDTLVVTAEHSPESVLEFCRLRSFKHREGNALQPSLVVVYDSSSHDKTQCSPVFDVDPEGRPTVTNHGKYYKNVRKEWASLVCTPNTALYSDALAFTRSLGDLHLHAYGVSHMPEVQYINLNEILSVLEASGPYVPPPTSDPAAAVISNVNIPPMICIVLATDGVWDNWKYEDVTKFVLDVSCLDAVATRGDGAARVAQSFMQRNSIHGKRNFGTQADNATGIVLYLSDAPSFIHTDAVNSLPY